MSTDLLSDKFKVAVCTALPVKGVNFILGNDIAVGKILEVLDESVLKLPAENSDDVPNVFPVCVFSHAHYLKIQILVSCLPVLLEKSKLKSSCEQKGQAVSVENPSVEFLISHDQVVAAQRVDPGLDQISI